MKGMYSPDVSEYLIALGSANKLEHGFAALASLVSKQGFNGISYSAMPKSLGKPGLLQPVFLSSDDFSAGFLKHYDEASLWQDDFTIARMQDGMVKPMNWQAELKLSAMTEAQRDVVRLAGADYGISNAITIPTQSDRHIIAGASVISSESSDMFEKLLSEKLPIIQFAIFHFHQYVFSRSNYTQSFYMPLIDKLSVPEKQLLSFVTTGRPLKQSKEFTEMSPTRAANVLSLLYQRMNVSNASELCFVVGHHKLLDML